MMNRRIAAAIVLMLAAGTVAHAQLNLRNLKDAAKKGLENVAGNNNGTVNNSGSPVPATKVKTFYVSATTGSARADGLSATSAMKDLQKAINTAEDDDIILVAEGNYLGNLDRGYIECGRFGNSSQASDRGKFISIYGGYAPDFSERDIIKYVTKLQKALWL